MPGQLEHRLSHKAIGQFAHLRADAVTDVPAVPVPAAFKLLVEEVLLQAADASVVIDTQHQRAAFGIHEAAELTKDLQGLALQCDTDTAGLGRRIDNAGLELEVLTLIADNDRLRDADTYA